MTRQLQRNINFFSREFKKRQNLSLEIFLREKPTQRRLDNFKAKQADALAQYQEKIARLAHTNVKKPYIEISIEWTKGSAYGPQATAELWTNGDYCQGNKTGGYGYCKKSTAAANAMNESEFLQALCLQKWHKINKLYGMRTRSGLPLFSGGVGMSCFFTIFEALGMKYTASNNTNSSD